MPTAGSEQRAHARIPVRVPVHLSSEMMDLDGEAEVAEVSNVSEGGLFVRSDFLEPVGTPVQMVVAPESGQSVAVSGYVVWVAENPPRGPGMGIRLDDGTEGRILVERLSSVVA